MPFRLKKFNFSHRFCVHSSNSYKYRILKAIKKIYYYFCNRFRLRLYLLQKNELKSRSRMYLHISATDCQCIRTPDYLPQISMKHPFSLLQCIIGMFFFKDQRVMYIRRHLGIHFCWCVERNVMLCIGISAYVSSIELTSWRGWHKARLCGVYKYWSLYVRISMYEIHVQILNTNTFNR